MRKRLVRDRRGSAAVEMALITPLLIPLLFGSFELGYYFYSNHILTKAVRDGARFASRQGFTKYSCPSTVDGTVVTNTRNVTRTNRVASGGSPRLYYWTDPNSISVTVNCVSNSGGTYGAFYEGMANIPVVRVSATVAYGSIFSVLGFNTTGINLTARSEAPVMGV